MKVVRTDSGECAAMPCDECEARGVAVIALGKADGASVLICLPCLIPAAIELADAKGDGLSIKHRPSPRRRS